MSAFFSRFAAFSVLVVFLLAPSVVFAWGAGMHTALTGHAYDRMTARWKSAMDPALMYYGSWGPDAWYILSDDFMSLLCPVSCGGANGALSNEGWGHYTDPDRYYNMTRHLMVHADSLPALSWAFGYGAHTVEDWRGHIEYIILSNPSGSLYNRHTFIDSTGAALAFNVEGLYGYPTDFTLNRLAFGYAEGGFVTDSNAEQTGGRIPGLGLSVAVEEVAGQLKARWKGILDPEVSGLEPAAVSAMSDLTAYSSASEGILAAQYGVSDWDSAGRDFPIYIEDGEPAIVCANDYKQRLACEEGFGYPMACQISYGGISGLVQWHDYLKPADETSQEVVVDRDQVARWMEKIAENQESGGVRMDDAAVFDVDPDTGLSRRHFTGIDGRDFSFGRTVPEIVYEVLDLSVQDVVERLFENPHIVGTIWQSRLNPFDKARFVAFGFHARPRLSAWPDTLSYEDETIALKPAAPGPFALAELSIDLRPEVDNAAPEMVFPHYLVEIRPELDGFFGTGRVDFEAGYVDEAGLLDVLQQASFDLATASVGGDEDFAVQATDAEERSVLRLWLDNREGGWHFYPEGHSERALMLRISLAVTDAVQPPFDLILDTTVQGYCEKPDLADPGDASTSNAACPLVKPDFPEEPEMEGDGDEESSELNEDGDTEAESGDEDQSASDGDASESPLVSDDAGGGGCQAATPSALGMLLLVLSGAWLRRRRLVF